MWELTFNGDVDDFWETMKKMFGLPEGTLFAPMVLQEFKHSNGTSIFLVDKT